MEEDKKERYRLKLVDIMGELSEAESHLSQKDPEISAEIRSLKKRVEKGVWGEQND